MSTQVNKVYIRGKAVPTATDYILYKKLENNIESYKHLYQAGKRYFSDTTNNIGKYAALTGLVSVDVDYICCTEKFEILALANDEYNQCTGELANFYDAQQKKQICMAVLYSSNLPNASALCEIPFNSDRPYLSIAEIQQYVDIYTTAKYIAFNLNINQNPYIQFKEHIDMCLNDLSITQLPECENHSLFVKAQKVIDTTMEISDRSNEVEWYRPKIGPYDWSTWKNVNGDSGNTGGGAGSVTPNIAKEDSYRIDAIPTISSPLLRQTWKFYFTISGGQANLNYTTLFLDSNGSFGGIDTNGTEWIWYTAGRWIGSFSAPSSRIITSTVSQEVTADTLALLNEWTRVYLLDGEYDLSGITGAALDKDIWITSNPCICNNCATCNATCDCNKAGCYCWDDSTIVAGDIDFKYNSNIYHSIFVCADGLIYISTSTDPFDNDYWVTVFGRDANAGPGVNTWDAGGGIFTFTKVYTENYYLCKWLISHKSDGGSGSSGGITPPTPGSGAEEDQM